MTAWNGGPCPDCGEEMPARVVRCRCCGAILNDQLRPPPVRPPEPVILPEITMATTVIPKAYLIGCPNCEQEIRIAAKYLLKKVACRHCDAPFVFDRSSPVIRKIAFFVDCPHCGEELKAAEKYLEKKVACKHCDQPIHLVLEKED